MKLLSFAVPCYNSQDYMGNCIESLLVGGDDVEIIVVDDGSKDNTAAIADEYAAKYPGIVKAVHQENGGHGEAVNTGLLNATGLYFKVVDSDDWVDEESYMQILDTLKKLAHEDTILDMLISNYVYEKVGVTNKKVIEYRNALPRNRVFGWEEMGHFKLGNYLLMHSVIYRTGLLKNCGLKLPKHTFYVDNLYVFEPLPYVKKLYYLDVDFYRYYIGREDQSVNEQIMIGRIDQQIRVNKLMMDYIAGKSFAHKNMKRYMISYLEIITTVSSILMIISGTEENLEKKAELWQYLKQVDEKLYKRIRYGLFGTQMNLPGKIGRKISIAEYKIAQKFFNFN